MHHISCFRDDLLQSVVCRLTVVIVGFVASFGLECSNALFSMAKFSNVDLDSWTLDFGVLSRANGFRLILVID